MFKYIVYINSNKEIFKEFNSYSLAEKQYREYQAIYGIQNVVIKGVCV